MLANDALLMSLKGDPVRMMIRAEKGIALAAKNNQIKCNLEFSKHLYGQADVRVLFQSLLNKGFFCMLCPESVESANHIIEVRW